jgi:hypothetical protein
MRTKPFRLVLMLAALSSPLLADAPVPTPSPAGTTQAAAAPAQAGANDKTPTPSPTPVPTMPSTINLTNGTVLRNVSVIRWKKESVTLKHTGGADTIFYGNIAEPDRGIVLAVRDDAIKNHKTEAAPKIVDNSVKGTISVTTEDAAGVQLSGVKVYAVPMEALNLLSTYGATVTLPKPIASTASGPEGQFSLSVPAGVDYFIFAKAAKLVGQTWEYYEWRVPVNQVSDRQNVELTNAGVVPLADQKAVIFEK